MTQPWLDKKRSGATRAAQLRVCLACSAPTLVGLDADICAFTVRVDCTPIDQKGEAVALSAGRHTFDLVGGPGRKELHHRAPWNITAPRKYPVLPEHRCSDNLSRFAVAAESSTPKRKADDVCPF